MFFLLSIRVYTQVPMRVDIRISLRLSMRIFMRISSRVFAFVERIGRWFKLALVDFFNHMNELLIFYGEGFDLLSQLLLLLFILCRLQRWEELIGILKWPFVLRPWKLTHTQVQTVIPVYHLDNLVQLLYCLLFLLQQFNIIQLFLRLLPTAILGHSQSRPIRIVQHKLLW